MADTVKRLHDRAFMECSKLSLLRLCTSLEYLGKYAFKSCVKLEAVFIPESCREIGVAAFEGCEKLTILNVPQHVNFGIEFIADTALVRASPFNMDRLGRYEVNQHHEVVEWVRNINSDGDFTLHR
ncbi:hypothetical protein CTEN210_13557 [Chaetoceros tenuissimus]|uniref:Leucine-rich repeat domain-containing protein n=1 Tax=Chaetoceros tenuissimus TaxID=426638 RepID=A0AAD3D5J1_9STRA|nr:hypothetical protein CTEN210_13557 [Chaetoceros tenuissimus]